MTDEPDDKGPKVERASERSQAGTGGDKGVPPSLARTDGSADMVDAEKADAAAPEPPVRASSLDLHARLVYPDDGNFSRNVRKIDDYIGKAEQVVLVAILAAIVLTGAGHALLEKFAHIRLPFKDDVIRGGTFAIAMIGGAFATHQAKHLSMDLLSRRFSPRNRLFLKIVLSLFVLFVLVLLIRSGLHNIDNEKQFRVEDKLVSRVRIAWLIPIGGALMMVHTILHTIIDFDYIARRKTPPERMRSGH